MTFNHEDHISYREIIYSKVNLSNPKLLGLSGVEINPTELCNRSCSFCPRHDPQIYPNQNLQMDIKTVELLISQLKSANYDGCIHITGFGEPTLNPNILSIIKICSEYFFTELITNGDRLINGKLHHYDLKNAGLNSLIVDCYDGPDHVADMKKILHDCEIYYRVRDHHDTKDLSIIDMYNFNNRGGLLGNKRKSNNPCWIPFYKSFVDWNGQVRLCCNDWSRSHSGFGSIYEKSFDKIWMSDSFIKLRKALAKGKRDMFSSCENCNTCGTQNGSASINIWQKNKTFISLL